MKWWHASLALAALSLLAGCGGHKTKPSRGGHATHQQDGSRAGTSSSSSSDRFHDDLSRPQSSRYRDSTVSIPHGPIPYFG
jgi:rare lipoprotein A